MSEGDEEIRDDSLYQALVDHDATILQDLRGLREEGWKDESLDRHFEQQRGNADNVDPKMEKIWFSRMKKAFNELDEAAGILDLWDGQPLDFLDLGCCPCGFSCYILEANNQARGDGISLPISLGGHRYHLPYYLQQRFNLTWADITTYNLDSDDSSLPSKLQPLPLSSEKDLVILDGHFLRLYEARCSGDLHHSIHRRRLLFTQLVIALSAVKEGGTLVIKLSHPEGLSTAQLIYGFDTCSEEVVLVKPRSIHANRGTFYLVVKGVGLGDPERFRMLREGLKKEWATLIRLEICGREDAPKGGLDFIISVEELKEKYAKRLVGLAWGVWRIQVQALKKFFRDKDKKVQRKPPLPERMRAT